MPIYAAVDLGATSGRVVDVRVEPAGIALDVVSRFANVAVQGEHGALTWDFERLRNDVRTGLVAAATRSTLESIAIDSWGVDYGLLDKENHLVGPVHAYRSSRADGMMDDVGRRLGREHVYAITGIQFLAFNTLYQLAAARESVEYATAARLLMIPDLLNHDLCGSTTNEVTNASTTQLLDARTKQWSDTLVAELGLRRDVLPGLHEPGTRLGRVRAVDSSLDGVEVVAAASHDTASAVAGTPLRADRPGIYISCGTWSLVGCELATPVAHAEALAANVTNELGFGGTTRLLKNVTGLWLLEESRRAWQADGSTDDIVELVEAARHVPGGRSVIDPDDARFTDARFTDARFTDPGSGTTRLSARAQSMPARIADVCRSTGQPVPSSPAEVTRVILDSLALAWRRTALTIERIAGFEAAVIHLVGGGSANRLLGQLCASACERPVLVGPTEATVVGNALVQAIAAGVLGSLAEGRALVERMLPPLVIHPRKTLDWDALAARLVSIGAAP